MIVAEERIEVLQEAIRQCLALTRIRDGEEARAYKAMLELALIDLDEIAEAVRAE